MPHYRVVIERPEAGDLAVEIDAEDLATLTSVVESVHPGCRIISVHEQVVAVPSEHDSEALGAGDT